MFVVAGDFVLQSEFFLLETVEKVFVGMGAVLFLIDHLVKRRVLG